MAEIDNLSFFLGELKTAIKEGNEDRKRLFELVGEVKDSLYTLREEFKDHIEKDKVS